MLSRLSAADRAYDRIKSAILHGEIGAGPLDIGRVSESLRLSTTPVREALIRLHAERLVAFAPRHGYSVAPPDADLLRHLYTLSGQLIHIALRAADPAAACVAAPSPKGPDQLHPCYAEMLTVLLIAIARSQPNPELTEQFEQCSARLFPARRSEPLIFVEANAEVAALQALWCGGDTTLLRDRLDDHHAARVFHAGVIAQQMHKASDPR